MDPQERRGARKALSLHAAVHSSPPYPPLESYRGGGAISIFQVYSRMPAFFGDGFQSSYEVFFLQQVSLFLGKIISWLFSGHFVDVRQQSGFPPSGFYCVSSLFTFMHAMPRLVVLCVNMRSDYASQVRQSPIVLPIIFKLWKSKIFVVSHGT